MAYRKLFNSFDKKEECAGIWLWVLLSIGLFIRILDGWNVSVFMDELPIIYNITHFIQEKTLIPTHYSYPTFFSYLATPFVACAALTNYLVAGFPISGITDPVLMKFWIHDTIHVMVLGGRMVSVLVFLATLYLIMRRTNRFSGTTAALTAGLILVLDPAGGRYLAYSRYALPDVTAALFVTVSMLELMDYGENKKTKSLTIAAIAAGLAAGTKYNAAMVVFPIAAACWMERRSLSLRKLAATALLIPAGFLFASPAWLLKPTTSWAGFLFEARHMAEGHMGAYDRDWIWIGKYLWNLRTGFLFLAVSTVLFSLFRRKWQDWLLLFLVIPSVILIGRFEKKSIHYFIFLYPVLACYIGMFVQSLTDHIPKRYRRLSAAAIILSIVILPSCPPLLRMLRRDMTIDNRSEAAAWIRTHIPSGSSLLTGPEIWPDLLDSLTVMNSVSALEQSSPFKKDLFLRMLGSKPVYHLESLHDWHNRPSAIDSLTADWIVLSSLDYSVYFEEDTSKLPPPGSKAFSIFMRRKAFYGSLMDSASLFKPVRAFAKDRFPEFRIYRRKAQLFDYKERGGVP